MSAVVAPLKSHATPTTPLFIVLFVLNLTASTTGMFARQSVSNCCTQGTNQISCKNVLDNDTVICAQNYLKNASQMATQPFKIIFDTCDANLLPDDFFQPFPLNGLQMTKCGLTQVPYRLFSSFCDKLVNTLGFDDNQITSLNDNGFAGCRQLTELVLSTNLLTKIKPKYFESLDSLQSLYLSDNRLTDISGFGNLARLQKLDLRWNVITDVDKDAFNGLNGLLQLYMESNSISTLVDGTFDAFQRFGIMVTLGGRLQQFCFHC